MTTEAAPQRATVGFLLAHPAHAIALGFGAGLSRIAPGTLGTMLALPLFALLMQTPEPVHYAVIAVLFGFGIQCCEIAGRNLGVADHGSIVWDEIVPFWLVLLMTPAGWLWQLTAFALFRFFDITKPQPARWFDEHVKNGFGVMADDLIAAAYTLLMLALLKIVVS